MPSSAKRWSVGVSLKSGVGERGSQKMRVPSASAVMMCLPSGVKSPQVTGPVWPAKTCIVFPDGTARGG